MLETTSKQVCRVDFKKLPVDVLRAHDHARGTFDIGKGFFNRELGWVKPPTLEVAAELRARELPPRRLGDVPLDRPPEQPSWRGVEGKLIVTWSDGHQTVTRPDVPGA